MVYLIFLLKKKTKKQEKRTHARTHKNQQKQHTSGGWNPTMSYQLESW